MKTEVELKKDIDILAGKLGDMRSRCVSEDRNPSPEEIERGMRLRHLSRILHLSRERTELLTG